jgi:hypothetical protein
MSTDAERLAQIKKIQQQSIDAAMERARLSVPHPIMQPKPLPVPKFKLTSVTIPVTTTRRKYFHD